MSPPAIKAPTTHMRPTMNPLGALTKRRQRNPLCVSRCISSQGLAVVASTTVLLIAHSFPLVGGRLGWGCGANVLALAPI
jgi:hypothetical protein